jgi:hypothetical protein
MENLGFKTSSYFLFLFFSYQPNMGLPWNLRDEMLQMQGMFTGLLGNLSLLSYFTKKREKEVIVVQTLGVLSLYTVFGQLALAEAMPMPYFVTTSVVVGAGLVLNFMNYFGWLNAGIWHFWEDFITVGGLTVLPQVMSSLSLSINLYVCAHVYIYMYVCMYACIIQSIYSHAQTHTNIYIQIIILAFR